MSRFPLRVSIPTALLTASFATTLFTVSAQAVIVIDDFTTTGDASLYPATNELTFPLLLDDFEDAYGTIDGVPAARSIFFGPGVTAARAGRRSNFSGQQTLSLDTAAGEFTSTSTGDGLPSLALIYTGASLDQSSESRRLGRRRLRNSLPLQRRLQRPAEPFECFGHRRSSDVVSANEAIIDFVSGSNTLVVSSR